MAFAKLQKGVDNNQLGSGGMTGDAAPGQSGGTAGKSGQPSGFTNIQDYMKANAGDTTNQNYLNNAADKQIGGLKDTFANEQASLSTITQKPEASNENFQNILTNNEYANAADYIKPQSFTPTTQEFTNPGASQAATNINNLQGNLPSIMSYLGGVKPISQSYTPGMSKFDEMLLGGDKQFPGQFAQSKKDTYQSDVATPYSEAVRQRDEQKQQYNTNIDDWKNQFSKYVGAEQSKIQNQYQDLMDQYSAVQADPEWYAANPNLQAPTMGNAAYAYGQQNDLNDYNELSKLLSGGTYTPTEQWKGPYALL